MSDKPEDVQIGEAVLVAMAQARDLSAFRKLMMLYEGRVTYYVRRLIGSTDESEDAVQDIWVLVYRKLSTLRAPAAFRGWLYRIAHDVSISHIRRAARTPQALFDETGDSDVIECWDEFEAMDNADLVHRTLESLSHEHREVLTLRFLEQMEIEEIAAVVECAAGTVKSRLHYAKAALRKQIEEQIND
jgi:RNA polymerase sigma-70 factor, ECF subfamily